MFAQNGSFLQRGLAESISGGGPCFRRHRRQAHLFPSSSARVFPLLSSSAHVFLIPSSSAHVLPPSVHVFLFRPPGAEALASLTGAHKASQASRGERESHVQTSFPCAVSRPRYSSHYHQHHNSNGYGDNYYCDHYYHDYCCYHS